MKRFQLLAVDLPEDFKASSFDGLCVLIYKSRNFLFAWRDNNLLILQSAVIGSYFGEFKVLSVGHTVKAVFQQAESLYCLTSNGILYRLQECGDRIEEGFRSPQNIFDSSPERETDVTKREENGGTFRLKEVARFPGCMCIVPLQHGFVSVMELAQKLYVELFKITTTLDKVEKISSLMFCHNSMKVSSSCVMTSCKPRDISPDLISALLNDVVLINVEVVFIGLGSGRVYCAPVSLECGTVCLPKVIYNSVQPISGIICEADPAAAFCSQINVILATGPVVNISFNKDQKQLCYETAYFPSSVHTFCQAETNILVSDGLELWQCQFQRNEEEELCVDSTVVGVKGVHLLCAVKGTDQAVASTFDGSFYMVHSSGEQTSVPQPAEQYYLPSSSVSLIEQFQQLARLQKQIAYEDELMGGISVAMRAELLTAAFTASVEVWDWNVATATSHFNNQTLLSLIETNTVGENIKDRDLQDTYVLEINMDNMSEQDFSPSLWSVHISVVIDGVSNMKTTRLVSPFKRGSPFHTLMLAKIQNSNSSVELKCSLVFELPSREDIPSPSTAGAPWVVIPIVTTVLDATYFFTPLLGIYKGDADNDGQCVDYKSLLSEAQRNRQNLTGLPNVQQPPQSGSRKKEYTYILKIPDDVKHHIWPAVLKNCWHRCSKEVQAWSQSDNSEAAVNQSLTVTVGHHHVILTLTGSDVHLCCTDIVTLHAVKTALISAVGTTAGTSEVTLGNGAVERVLDLEARLKVEKLQPDFETLKERKKEWRNVLYDVPL